MSDNIPAICSTCAHFDLSKGSLRSGNGGCYAAAPTYDNGWRQMAQRHPEQPACHLYQAQDRRQNPERRVDAKVAVTVLENSLKNATARIAELEAEVAELRARNYQGSPVLR